MLISIVGSPASGKTTTAASIFADLKNSSQSAEFLPEVARFYIAKLRQARGLNPSQGLSLTDEDQLNIMREQSALEKVLLNACGSSVVIVSDSSPLNALLYMSEAQAGSSEVQFLIQEHLERKPMVFYSKPVGIQNVLDPNRIHSRDFSEKADQRIPGILAKYGVKAIALTGNGRLRSSNALAIIYAALEQNV